LAVAERLEIDVHGDAIAAGERHAGEGQPHAAAQGSVRDFKIRDGRGRIDYIAWAAARPLRGKSKGEV
jgi:hypothetical protein